MAPSKLPRWRSPVGWIPETTRIASADIGVRPPSPEERAKLLLVGPAEDPHQREVHGHPATDERNHSAKAVPDRAGEPRREDHAQADQRRDHCPGSEQLPRQPRRQPGLDPEM